MDLLGLSLSGEIPPELGSLTNLEKLSLGSNKLRGEIPPELGSLTMLKYLTLDGHEFSGCVPSALQDQLDMNVSRLGSRPFC